MSEIFGEHDIKPQDPELLPSQLALKDLSDEILASSPPYTPRSSERFKTSVDPEVVQERLRASSLGDLMLKDGDSLSAVPPSDYYRDLNLFVGQAVMTEAYVTTRLWEHDKQRFDPNGPDRSPFSIVDYPGEKDWVHQLDIGLWYSDGMQDACQKVTISTGSALAGNLPSMSRDVLAVAYVEQGYSGHNQVSRPAKSDEEALGFIALARELFDARVSG